MLVSDIKSHNSGDVHIKRAIIVLVSFFFIWNTRFSSFAAKHLLPLEGDEYQEIVSMKDEVLYQINFGGARTELDRNVEENEVEMNRAYKVYSDSGLLKAKNPKEALRKSSYIWQIPVYTDGVTVLVDITKVTSIPEDVPEDAKEMLEDDLNRWTVGAVYVYREETVDYDRVVTVSLQEAGYNSDNYSYEVVSGLPGIRYPVAVIWNADEDPKFVIPVQRATLHAFHGEWPTADKISEISAPDEQYVRETGFPVYYYEDTVRAANAFRLSGMGLSYKKGSFENGIMLLLILGIPGVLVAAGRHRLLGKKE